MPCCGEVGARFHLAGAEIDPRARIQHGVAEVDVIDQHHRLGRVTLVDHGIADVQNVALGFEREVALHQHVGGKDLGLMYLAGYAEHALVALDNLRGRKPARRACC